MLVNVHYPHNLSSTSFEPREARSCIEETIIEKLNPPSDEPLIVLIHEPIPDGREMFGDGLLILISPSEKISGNSNELARRIAAKIKEQMSDLTVTVMILPPGSKIAVA